MLWLHWLKCSDRKGNNHVFLVIIKKIMKNVIKRQLHFANAIFGFLDVAATTSILFLSIYITNVYSYFKVSYSPETFIIIGVLVISWVILLKISNLSRIPRTSSYSVILYDFIKLSVIGGFVLVAADWVIVLDTFPAVTIILFMCINTIILYLIRIFTFKFVKIYRANGHNLRNIIIIADEDSDEIIEKVYNQKEWGFRVLGLITDSNELKIKYHGKIKVFPYRSNIKSIIKYDIIDEIICLNSLNDDKKIYELIDFCSELGVTFRIKSISMLHASSAYKSRVQYFGKIPFYTIENNPNNSFSRTIKLISEVSLAFIILFIASPLLLIISLIIATTSRGPVIFKQARVGLRGRQFYIYKFRTMVQNAEALKLKLQSMNESDGPTFKIKNDPRITTIGRLLRKTNLDEIPQLFNVIKGEMSIIGPRPPLPIEVEQYQTWQLKRLSVKPGLTCTWQIAPNRNEVKFEKWMQMDINYIDNWSLLGDVLLLFRTFRTVIMAKSY
jgi:exopolysaccharide biosynthesis polyprenyl glycosylphosphotransferase